MLISLSLSLSHIYTHTPSLHGGPVGGNAWRLVEIRLYQLIEILLHALRSVLVVAQQQNANVFTKWLFDMARLDADIAKSRGQGVFEREEFGIQAL